MATPTQTRTILIKVDTSDGQAIKKIADQMGLLNNNTKSLAGNMNLLTNAFKSWLGFLGVRQLANMSDEVQNLTNRLKITAQAGEDTSDTFQKIVDTANTTKLSIGAVGEVYNKLALAFERIKPTSTEIISLTQTLIESFKISGSSAEEAAEATQRLSLSFALGSLQGKDLRATLRQNVALTDLLRQKFGGDIFKGVEKGTITVSTLLKVLGDNAEEIHQKALILAPTFSQTLTVAMNKLSVGVGNLNDQFGLSAKFADIMSVAFDNMGNVLIVVSGLVAVFTISRIPAMIKAIQALQLALLTLAESNPILLALTAITVAAALIYNNFDKLVLAFKKVEAAALDFAAKVEEALSPLEVVIARATGLDPDKAKKDAAASAAAYRKSAEDIRDEIAKTEAAAKKAAKTTTAGQDINNLAGREKGTEPAKLQKIKEILGDVNKEFLNGSISVEQYNQKLVNFDLYKLNREFSEGKFDIFTYNQKLKELDIEGFNRLLKNGTLSLQDYRESVRDVNIQELTAKFEAGKISLIEYNTQLVKLSDQFLPGSALLAGTAAYIESIGTLSDNIAKGITSTFSSLEDNLVDFVKTGTFNFAKMTQSILDDLTRIIIRASIVKPLAGAILNGFSPSSNIGPQAGGDSAKFDTTAAKGAAFYNGVKKFAAGGVVSSPTAFQYGGGKSGLMGEAGSEAILPLQRASNGDLGVAASTSPVTINIINQAGVSVDQKESTGPSGDKTIELLITSKVKDGILTGKFDGPMKQAYGVNRKGA